MGFTSLSQGQAETLRETERGVPLQVAEVIKEMTVEWKGRTYDAPRAF